MSCAPRRLFLPVLILSSVLFATVVPIGAITVTSLADSGPGSLREAIDTANSDGIPTTIDFAPGLAGGTIALASQLPDLSEDGTELYAANLFDGRIYRVSVPDGSSPRKRTCSLFACHG